MRSESIPEAVVALVREPEAKGHLPVENSTGLRRVTGNAVVRRSPAGLTAGGFLRAGEEESSG